METKYFCPECGGDNVWSSITSASYLNTLEHYCHLVKNWDVDSPSGCSDCGWRGFYAYVVKEES